MPSAPARLLLEEIREILRKARENLIPDPIEGSSPISCPETPTVPSYLGVGGDSQSELAGSTTHTSPTDNPARLELPHQSKFTLQPTSESLIPGRGPGKRPEKEESKTKREGETSMSSPLFKILSSPTLEPQPGRNSEVQLTDPEIFEGGVATPNLQSLQTPVPSLRGNRLFQVFGLGTPSPLPRSPIFLREDSHILDPEDPYPLDPERSHIPDLEGSHVPEPKDSHLEEAMGDREEHERHRRAEHDRHMFNPVPDPTPAPTMTPTPQESGQNQDPVMATMQAMLSALAYQNSLAPLGPFKGDAAIHRWIGGMEDVIRQRPRGNLPSTIIRGINQRLEGPPAAFIDGSFPLRNIVSRADRDEANAADLANYKDALLNQYPTMTAPMESFVTQKLSQKPGEPLPAYFSRALNVLHNSGSRDRVGTPPPILSLAEESLLQRIIYETIEGLSDPDLYDEVMSHSALSSSSLKEAMEAVYRAQRAIERRLERERQRIEKGRTENLARALAQVTGMDPDAYLREAAATLPRLIGNAQQVQAMNANLGNPNLRVNHVEVPTNTMPPAFQGDFQNRNTFFTPRSHSPDYRQTAPQSGGGNVTGNEKQVRFEEPVMGQPTPGPKFQTPFPSRGGRGGYANQGNRSGGWTQSSSLPSLPPRTNSKNGYVNGTIPMQKGVAVCFKCGTPGHYSSNCHTPADKHLASWESAYLKSMAFTPPDRSRDAPPGGTVDIKSAQLYYQQFLEEGKPQSEPMSQSSSSSSVMTPTSSVSACSVTLWAGEVDSETKEASGASEEPYQADEPGRDPFEYIEEVTDDPTPSAFVAAKSSSAKTDSPGERSQSVDRKSQKKAKSKSSRRFRRKLEQLMGKGDVWQGAAEQLVDVMVLAAGLEPTSKKRKAAGGAPIPIEPEEIERGETSQTPGREGSTSTAAEGGDKKPKTRKGLTEIRARSGMGQIDWLEMANKVIVPMSLVDFWQVSPEGAKQFRNLSSRRTLPRGKKDKGKGPAMVSVKAASMGASSLSDSHNTMLVGNRDFNPKSFRLPVTITIPGRQKGTVRTFSLPKDSVQADQGSEANFISQKFVIAKELEMKELSDIKFKGLIMTNADGRRTPVTHYVVMNVTCGGITREIWAIVNPQGPGTHDEVIMLLGLPWLFDVQATFDIGGNTLEIGVTSAGESRKRLKGPILTLMPNQKIMLAPDSPELLKAYKGLPSVTSSEMREVSDDEDDDSTSDEEGESDTDSDVSGEEESDTESIN